MGEQRVEISSTKNKLYIVVIEDTGENAKKHHCIELYERQAQRLLNSLNGSYESLLEQLEFPFGKMQLRDLNAMLYKSGERRKLGSSRQDSPFQTLQPCS